MNSQSAFQLLGTIDQTIIDIDSISGVSPLTDSYLAKFLVVYISGIYEETIETIFVDFFLRNTNRMEIVTYARTSVGRSFRNPNSKNCTSLFQMLGNSSWITTIGAMRNEAVALDSIITNKNSIAHGQDCVITLSEVKDFYTQSRPLIEKIDTLLA